MKISELNSEYDKLQLQYGAKELTSIYNGGCTNNPDFCFVFMNPTGKNIASDPNWKGRRSPWIGTKNIWKLFYRIGLLDEEIHNDIISKKPQEWSEEFADIVYTDVEKHKYFITNLGKCTQVDARVLPNSVYSEYLDLLCKEIEIINPKTIITLGNQNKKIAITPEGKEIYDLDLELTPYEVFKEKGADKLIEIIEKGNFHELGESIPKRGEDKLIAEFYEKLKIGDIDYIDKNYYLNCEKELYELQEIEANELLKMVEHDNTIEMKQAEMKDYENTMGTAEGKSGFDDSMEAETKASDVQKATHDIRKINEQQQEITNGDRWR